MKNNSPAAACGFVPVTGASRNSHLFSAAAAARSLTQSTEDRGGDRTDEQGDRQRPLRATDGDVVVDGDRRDQRCPEAADDGENE